MTERELVHKVKLRERRAMAVLIERYEKLVYHILCRMVHSEEDRQELVQDVFLRVFRKIGQFKFQSKLSTWIGSITYHLALNHIKKHKARQDALENSSTDKEFWDESYENEDHNQFIRNLVDKLPYRNAVVLSLYHLEAFSIQEIAKITECPEGTVKSDLFRARKKLRELMKPYLVSVHTVECLM